MSTVTRFQISEIHSAFVRRKILSNQAGPGAVPPGDEPVDLSPGVAAGVEEWLAGVGLPDVGPALEAEAAVTELERRGVTGHTLSLSSYYSSSNTSSSRAT